jgi:hypothetical protein
MDGGSAVAEAFVILVRIGVGVLVWKVARHFATEDEPTAKTSPVVAYGRVAFACAVFAVIAWSNYGTEVEPDDDPLRGSGTRVTVFEPSDAERNRHGLTVFLVTFVLAGHGTWSGRKEQPRD